MLSINSYNGLVKAYYRGEVERPRLLKYRKKDGLAAVAFPKQLLRLIDGRVYPPISKEAKPHLIDEISLHLPEFIDFDWVKEVTIRPNNGELWIDWVIECGSFQLGANRKHWGMNWVSRLV